MGDSLAAVNGTKGRFVFKNQTQKTNMKVSSTFHAHRKTTKPKFLFVALLMMVVSSTSLLAADMAGRYAIESAKYPGKFLRGLPEQGKEVVAAAQNQATVFQVRLEKDDAYSLQSHVFFLSIEGRGHDVVMHKANGVNEKFKITDNGDGTYSLMAVWNKKYAAIDETGSVASSPTAGPETKFKLAKK